MASETLKPNLIKHLKLVLLLIIASAIILVQARDIHHGSHQQQLKETKLTVYFQDITAGPNATVVPVAGIAVKAWSFAQFGTVFVVDEPVTETPSPNSALLGRCQGVFVSTGLDGLHALVSVSVMFRGKEYNGSTIELFGNVKQLEPVREVSVVSGTGNFRFARGFATFESYFLDMPGGYSVVRCNIIAVVP